MRATDGTLRLAIAARRRAIAGSRSASLLRRSCLALAIGAVSVGAPCGRRIRRAAAAAAACGDGRRLCRVGRCRPRALVATAASVVSLAIDRVAAVRHRLVRIRAIALVDWLVWLPAIGCDRAVPPANCASSRARPASRTSTADRTGRTRSKFCSNSRAVRTADGREAIRGTLVGRIRARRAPGDALRRLLPAVRAAAAGRSRTSPTIPTPRSNWRRCCTTAPNSKCGFAQPATRATTVTIEFFAAEARCQLTRSVPTLAV